MDMDFNINDYYYSIRNHYLSLDFMNTSTYVEFLNSVLIPSINRSVYENIHNEDETDDDSCESDEYDEVYF